MYTTEGINESNYARKRRQLVELVDQLRACGASTEIDLPRIAVLGSQSAGKSSIVEAISGIKVPRDAGTCTRCPMEVRLRSSTTAWNCKVSLRFETGPDGRPLDKVVEKRFGPTLSRPEDVEAVLRRAQLAILNPSVANLDFFLKLSDKEVERAKLDPTYTLAGSAHKLTFSTNVVCVDVSGSSLTDLTFLDLPGIIAHSDVEADIALVENMAKEAIKGNCLILLTVTMRDDLQNQKAVGLAQKADPSGSRTIGVLTKADLVQDGEHPTWIDMLEGRKDALKNGYFVTKQPAPDDLRKNLSFLDARKAEVDYFKTAKVWSELQGKAKARLGTANLTADLSDKLARFIAEKLPFIQADLSRSLKDVLAGLHGLPPPPSADPATEVHLRLASLAHDLDRVVDGSIGHLQLINAKNSNDKIFKSNILKTRPVFVPHPADAPEAFAAKKDKESSAFPPLKMNLTEAKSHIDNHKARELPLNTPYGSKVDIMTRATEHWPVLASQALDGMQAPVGSAVNKVVDEIFGRGTNSELRGIVDMTVADTIEELFDATTERLNYHLQLDSIPFTLNDHYFSDQVVKALGLLKVERHKKSPHIVGGYDYSQTLAHLASVGYQGVKEEDLPRLLGPDKWEEELSAMAHTTAYWKVAYKRIIDDVPRIIDFSLIRALPSALHTSLLKRLVSGGEESVIKRLMMESPELAEERAELNSRKSRLEDAKKVLAAFGHGLKSG